MTDMTAKVGVVPIATVMKQGLGCVGSWFADSWPKAFKGVLLLILAGMAVLAGCQSVDDTAVVRLAAIGPLSVKVDLPVKALTPANGSLRAAIAQGLVSYDSSGVIEAGLAERWNITGDGLSYIFRLRKARWAGGKKVTAQDVAQILNRYIHPRRGHVMRDEFTNIDTIRAVTDQVIEIRLKQPQPFLLELLAQPAMGLARRGKGWGPLRVRTRVAIADEGATDIATSQAVRAKISAGEVFILSPMPDPIDDNVEDTDFAKDNTPSAVVEIYSMAAPYALAQFYKEAVEGVIGGSFDDFPYYIASDIPQSRLIVDSTPGLFGLIYLHARGFLASEVSRDALAMVIRRNRILAAFQYKAWQPQATVQLSENFETDIAQPFFPAWVEQSYDQRVEKAAQYVRDYQARGYEIAPIKIALPPGPGGRIVFAYIAADLRLIGLEARKVALDDIQADLRLIDEVALSDDPIWALRRVNCGLGRLCNREADKLIRQAEKNVDSTERIALLSQAEELLVSYSSYIPLATPLRWSLISRRLSGFQGNARAQHRLDRLLDNPS